MAQLTSDTVLLFYREPRRGPLRRTLAPAWKRLRRRQDVTGFGVWFHSLVEALRGEGVEVVVNDRALAARHPEHPVGLVGYPEVLEGWDLPNPAVLGPGLLDHPRIWPTLMEDRRFRRYLVTCAWMEELFRPWYGDACARWYGPISPSQWPDARHEPKALDVLVYDKIRWDRDRREREILLPALRFFAERGLRWQVLRYGRHRQEEYRALLRRSRALLFLCEHETQGMAYQEALATNVPVLAWDSGLWLDPRRTQWQEASVPASSVPYFSEECGRRFRGAADFAEVASGFFADLPRFEPRRFVCRELSPSGSAQLYLRHYRALLPPPRALAVRPRVQIGRLAIDRVDFGEAVDRIEGLVDAAAGGSVFTPNVDHVVTAEALPGLREAYARAALSLVDGTPLVWASHLLGRPLPERVAGSDLVDPLIARAARRGWRVFLTGGAPGIAERAAVRLAARHPGLRVAGVDCPRIALLPGDESEAAAVRARDARADLILVGFGSPKQELWVHRHLAMLRPAVLVAVGAGLDFAAGERRRAPAFLSRAGLEWAWRLALEPRRLWRRYLVNDPRFLLIVGRALVGRALAVRRPAPA